MPYMWNLKSNDTNDITYKTETDSQTSRMSLWLQGEGWWEGIVKEFVMGMYTLIYLKWIKIGPTVQHMELCSMLHGSWDGRGVQGKMDTCMCMAESLCQSSETITTLLIGYTPRKNKVKIKTAPV